MMLTIHTFTQNNLFRDICVRPIRLGGLQNTKRRGGEGLERKAPEGGMCSSLALCDSVWSHKLSDSGR
jgi:hypothetical protein